MHFIASVSSPTNVRMLSNLFNLLRSKAQEAALGFESAMVLATLLRNATRQDQLPALLRLYNTIGQPRTSLVIPASKRMENIMHYLDKPLQAD